VKIFLQPRQILAALLTGSAMTTGRFATGNAHELTALNRRDFFFRRWTGLSESQGGRN
jgi:hypothetical protein